jgi:hypothetical protein
VQGQIGPAADGRALVLDVECRTSTKQRGPLHPVTITPDWQLETPHDLAAERIAMAFGGYCSCVLIADQVVPALRVAVQLLARQAPAPIGPAPDRGWVVGSAPAGCQCRMSFLPTAQAAAEHARSALHLAHVAGTTERRFGAFLDRVVRAHDHFPVPAHDRALERRVRDAGGIGQLWRAGLTPDQIADIAALVPGSEPLPVEFFLGVAYRPVNRAWLRATLVRRPDPDVATFLAWSGEVLHPHPDDRCGDWLELGIPTRAIEDLLRAGTSLDSVQTISLELGWSRRVAANYLAGWARAGCEPTVAHVRLLARLGIDRSYVPSPPAINLLEMTASDLGEPPSRTDLAVLLAVAGTRAFAIDLLERGITHPLMDTLKGHP